MRAGPKARERGMETIADKQARYAGRQEAVRAD